MLAQSVTTIACRRPSLAFMELTHTFDPDNPREVHIY